MPKDAEGHNYFFGGLPEMPWKKGEINMNENTLVCADCGSHNIIEVTIWQAYMREGDYVRLRGFHVQENINAEAKKFIASCPEKSRTATAIGETPEKAIENLGKILAEMGLGRLVRNELK